MKKFKLHGIYSGLLILFIYSEKATNIKNVMKSPNNFFYDTMQIKFVRFCQILVAFSEYINFKFIRQNVT